MNITKRYWIYIVGFAMTLSITVSCGKDYYDDGGVHEVNFDGTVMDFLESRPDLFDTLTTIVKLADFENTLRTEEVTFFAPPNTSIRKTVNELNEYLYRLGQDTVSSPEQVDASVWRHFLSMYVLKGKSLLKDFSQIDTLSMQAFPGQGYYTYDGEEMNVGVLYNDIKTKNSDGVEQIIRYAGYRQLYLNAYGGFSIHGLTTAPVATSDIQPRNGSVHVLQYSKHAFGFNSIDFIQLATARGITYPND